MEVERPAAFAVPVEKRGKGHEAPVVNREAHLMLYSISPHAFGGPTAARDQFGDYEMRLYRSVFLAVPTKKIEVS